MAKGKFVVKTTPKGGFRFNLVASNGQVIATSQTYKSKASCINGLESVRKNSEIAKIEDHTVDPIDKKTNPKFEMYKDKAGEFRFRLKARNGEIIAVSEGYKAKVSCINGMESVKNHAPEAEIVDTSLEEAKE
jgi:uncharacterized protein YegP (UPF0339 family)